MPPVFFMLVALVSIAVAAVAVIAHVRLARAITSVAGSALAGAPADPWTALRLMGRELVAGRPAEGRALVETELRRELMEAALDPIISVDGSGRVVDFNRAAELAFGRPARDVAGRPVAMLLDPESLIAAQRQAFSDFLATPQDSRRDHRVTAVGRRTDGTTFPLDLSVTVLATERGPLFCASLRDVSDRLEAMQARRESVAKSQFLTAMSHELRTPLNSILGFAQLLASGDFGPLNSQQRRYVRNIEVSGNHLLSVINEVLDLAKVQSGRTTMEPAWVDMAAVVRGVAAEAAPLAAQKSLVFDVSAPGESPVYADPIRLRQVLTNLVSNAVKFTPAGGRVAVRCQEVESGEKVRVDVQDTGPGIARADVGRIFEEFVQLDTGGDSASGTGLGLPISRRLMELMGGTLEVVSEPGEGSTFTMLVPARVIRRLDRPAPAQARAACEPCYLLKRRAEAAAVATSATVSAIRRAVLPGMCGHR